MYTAFISIRKLIKNAIKLKLFSSYLEPKIKIGRDHRILNEWRIHAFNIILKILFPRSK